MTNDEAKIRSFLQEYYGRSFTEFITEDESVGRWVKNDKVVNSFLVRYLKCHIVPEMETGMIGDFLYRDCSDIIRSYDHWTTKEGKNTFWYAWQSEYFSFDRLDGFLKKGIVLRKYLLAIYKQLNHFQDKWDEPLIIYFGKSKQFTGRMPNYQIEVSSGEKRQAFYGKDNGLNNNVEVYDYKKLSRSFTADEFRDFYGTF